ncbi:phage Gp15 protein [Streptococcus pneumoniae]|nr:phage Gp15 protein [Streptococcus pneumoniae]
MTRLEQAQLIVHLLTGQELYDIKEVVDCWIYIKEHFLGIEKETVQYDLLGNPMPKAKGEEEQEKLIDFEQDAEYIFMQQIIEIRAWKPEYGGDKNKMRKLQAKYSLGKEGEDNG